MDLRTEGRGQDEYNYYQTNDAYPLHFDYPTTGQHGSPQGHSMPVGYAPPQESPMMDPKAHVIPVQTETEWSPYATTPIHPLKETWFDRMNHGWMPEIVSQVFSILFLLALAILLARLEGRPLSTWTIALSPNAVVAILSIASKASLIYAIGQTVSQLKWLHLSQKPDRIDDLQHYDDASRGPLGALRLFYTVRSASFVVYVGCLVILLALAFEPFSQQLLHFDEQHIVDPDQRSSVSFSTAYDNQFIGVSGATLAIVLPRDNEMTAAAVNGLYGVVKEPPFKCPGSTCSYPTITTFGLCSECNDITSTIKKRRLNVTYGEIWEYRTPFNQTLQASSLFDAHSGFKHTSTNATAQTVNKAYAGLGMPVQAAVIRFLENEESVSNDSNWMQTMEAYECMISFCGRRFVDWTTANGTLISAREEIIKLNNSDTPGADSPIYRAFPPLNPADSLDIPSGNNSFSINYLDGENIANILTSIFTIRNEVPANQQVGAGALYSSPDIIKTIDNVATGMSYRMMDGPNKTTMYGDVYKTQTYIRVRWPWLALPIALALASTACLIVVIVLTKSTQQRVWKSSLKPLLLPEISYPLTTGAGANDGQLDGTMGLQSRSRTITSHLTRS